MLGDISVISVSQLVQSSLIVEQKHKSMTMIILTEMRQETDADYLSKLMIDRGKVFGE